MHPVEYLRTRLDTVRPYPSGMVEIASYIDGLAFFPGGSGLWGAGASGKLRPLPTRPVMLVGQDFDWVEGYAYSLKKGEESTNEATWRELIVLLNDANLPLEECFFTNAIMGVREGAVAVGESPVFLHPEFRSRCATFLRVQAQTLMPRALITLGKQAARVAGVAFPCLSRLMRDQTFYDIDAAGLQYAAEVKVPTIEPGGETSFRFAAITHPSYRRANVRSRRFRAFQGHQAELELVRAVAN